MAVTILIIDDEPDIVEIVRHRLEQDGYSIVSAVDGLKGLALVREQAPDLILLDVMMPGIDGFAVARVLKNNPQTAAIPLIMLTAKADFHSVAQGWNVNVDNYITKPFDLDELARAIKSALQSRGKLGEA